MGRFLTCLKVLAAPLVLCISALMVFFTIELLSILTDSFGVAARMKYLIVVVAPLVKDLVWPLASFCVACLFKDDIVAVLAEIKCVFSRVRELHASGVSLSFAGEGGGDHKIVSDNEGTQEVPRVKVDRDEAMKDYCLKDAAHSFGLVLQPKVEVSYGGEKMTFPWVDARGQKIKAFNVIRVKDFVRDVSAYMESVDDFLRRSKMRREDFSLFIYGVWENSNAVKQVNTSDFDRYNIQTMFKTVNLDDCLATAGAGKEGQE